jgi:hypothetical protein
MAALYRGPDVQPDDKVHGEFREGLGELVWPLGLAPELDWCRCSGTQIQGGDTGGVNK